MATSWWQECHTSLILMCLATCIFISPTYQQDDVVEVTVNGDDVTNSNNDARYLQHNDHWPQGIVPFTMNTQQLENIKDINGAMAFYEYFTSIRFVTWNKTVVQTLGHKGHLVYITTWGRGYSLLGMYDFARGQNLDCPRLRTCVHEIGHSLGYEHEQYHYERDKWIRINRKAVSNEYESWSELAWTTNYDHTHFDWSSFMLYPPTTWSHYYDVLFAENTIEQRQFYMFKELCNGYSCDQSKWCIDEQLTCDNEGYVSVVNDKCTCVCLPGLDPDTQCTTILKKGAPQWPSGQFSLLQHVDGCPNGNFQKGYWRHYGIGENKKPTNDFVGDVSGKKTEFSFCTMTSDSGAGQWPPGAYCFLKKGACPLQKGVHAANMSIFGDYDRSRNAFSGSLPDGTFNVLDPSINFCCMRSGFTYMPARFPNTKPFILFAQSGEYCQEVDGMVSKLEKFGIHSPQIYGYISRTWSGYLQWVYYCVYTPLNRDCGEIVELGPNNRQVTIESDKTNRQLRECNWMFKAKDDKGTLVITFDEFNVPSRETNCDDYVEVQNTMVAQRGARYCDEAKMKSMQSLFGKLRVALRSGKDSTAYFKATVKWIPDSEMCYDVTEGGQATYRGNVNYTRAFEPCLPWTETTTCLHNPYTPGDYTDGLEGNACRNPDGGFRPWCFTKLEGCKRNFCDVCQLGEPYDKVDNCADVKQRGACKADSMECADTCGLTTGPTADVVKVKDVQCSSPGAVSGGDLQSTSTSSFPVGTKVTYKCRKSGNIVERTCQNTGKWSPANTACLSCPQGYFHYRDNCYIHFEEHVSFTNAERRCKDIGATLALPTSQGENDIMSKIKNPYNTMWIGATNSNTGWKTMQGTNVTFVNWKWYDVPHPYQCAYMREDNFWKDTESCGWSLTYSCQRPVTDANPECKDFLNNCPALVSNAPNGNCDLEPGLDTFCRYSCDQCSPDCQTDINLDKTNTKHVITADRRTESKRFCVWNIKAPNKQGRLVIRFQDFSVTADGDNCIDSVEIRETKYGRPYNRYCGDKYNRSVVVVNDHMMVKFRTPGQSVSHFTAEIEWIQDESMCYNATDKGWSYDGKVNYDDEFEPCMAWSDAFLCENNTLWNSYFLDNLENNYCRNPDNSDRPWCYNKECQKQFCDVCHLKLPKDNSNSCQSFKQNGYCQSDKVKAATQCAETCRSEVQGTKVEVSTVSCRQPSAVPGGTLQSAQRSYSVGDQATYKCTNTNTFIKRTCLASGTWSQANTACLDCPYGFIMFGHKCFKYFPEYTDKFGAKQRCASLNGVVAAPVNMEENDFVSSLRDSDQRIWLGGRKGIETFMWNDGTEVTWPNWDLPKKKFQYRDQCMVLELDKTRTDDWCADKLFHFVCQVEATPYQDQCVDYTDSCSSFVQALPQNDCSDYPSLQQYCQSSCGLCIKKCSDGAIRLTSGSIYNLKSDDKSGQFCAWNFEGDATNGRFVVNIDKFDVNSPNRLMITSSVNSDTSYSYSGSTYTKTTYIYNKYLILEFKGKDGIPSSFELTVKWIKDSDMCYNVTDKGASYVGTVNYDKSFNKCYTWDLHCPHNPLKNEDLLDHLESNYCRNPDGSDQPWCYDINCRKQYCDVCQLETPVDIGDACALKPSSGTCSKDSSDCALTCQIAKKQNIKAMSSVKCGPPSSVPGGRMQGSAKSQYGVGDKVVFTCTKSTFTVERVCLTSGQWSVAETACLDCPTDHTHFQGKCYQFVDKAIPYVDAKSDCESKGAALVTTKTQVETNWVHSFVFYQARSDVTSNIWLGAQKNTKNSTFDWNDGTPFTYAPWTDRETFSTRDNCVLLTSGNVFNDDWCHDKYFNFVCQRPAATNPDCADFLDNCQTLIKLPGKQMCDADSRLESVCRKSCGLCDNGCDYKISLDSSNPSYDISSDRRQQNNRFCTWHFNSDNSNGRFVLQFNDFSVPSPTSTSTCMERVEIRNNQNGPVKQTFCENTYEPEAVMLGSKMVVRFRTLERSQAYFKATVQWVKNADLCYSATDKGRSYNGDVNYTESFKQCLPWSQSLKCADTPLKEENLIVTLSGNKCRNPDNSERPWCYTYGCHRQYCDVCHLEKPFDNKDCTSFKANRLCTIDPQGALEDCAKTCGVLPSQRAPKVSSISCGRPTQVPGSTIQEKLKASYAVGEIVTYNCSRSISVVQSTCLTSGQWSAVKTACLNCPVGWIAYNKKCYRHINKFLTFAEAVDECKTLKAIVAPTKNEDVYNFVVDTFLPDRDYLWLGGTKNPKTDLFEWTDGTQFTWTNWKTPKTEAKRDACGLISSYKWNDDWCHDKYFSFVCRLDSDETPDCVDFLDSCSEYKQAKGSCDSILTKNCRKTCGACQ